MIAGCATYVDAQLEYFSEDRRGDGYLQFAQKVNSTAGMFDGLYWSSANGEDVSLIGPFAAQSAGVEANLPGERTPYNGYYFKIVTAQGAAAPGGARNYVVNDRMTEGFAMVAWPADYHLSGVSTVMVNQLGTVYQKELGPHTAQLAPALNQFNPDSTWTKVED